MIYTLTDLNESEVLLETEDTAFKHLIIESLSVFVEGYKFTPSFRAGIWNGKKEFFSITQNGDIKFPKGLVSNVIGRFKKEEKQFTYNRIIHDIKEPTKNEFDEWIKTLGLPFTPYDYQSQAAYDAIRHKRLVIQAATGCLDPKTEINVSVSPKDLDFLRKNFKGLVFDIQLLRYTNNIETILTFEEIAFLKNNNRSVYVEEPKGYTEVTNIFEKEDEGYKVTFNDGTEMKCARTHRLLIDNKWKPANEFDIDDVCIDKYGNDKKHIITIENLQKQKWLDFSVDNEFESYIQNDIIHHNSGKSLILSLIMQWQFKEKRKMLLIVPNVLLLKQMKQDMIDYFGKCDFNNNIITIGGDSVLTIEEKEEVFKSNSVILSTWQSLYKNPDLVQDVECILIDEAHGAKGDAISLLAQAAENCIWRIGLTGTMPRNYADKMSILAILGKGKNYITPQGLVERGLATPVHITTLFFNYSEEDRKTVKVMKDYAKEIKFLSTHDARNIKIANITQQMSKLGNTLLLFDVVAHGKKLLELLVQTKTHHKKVRLLDKITPKYVKEVYEEDALLVYNGKVTDKERDKLKKILSKFNEPVEFNKEMFHSLVDYNIYFIYGGVEANLREEIRQIVKDKQNVTVIGNYQTVATGLNIPSLMNVILGASTKSFIRLGQTIGRGMRLHDSKERMNLIDICDDLQWKNPRSVKENYTYKHFMTRFAMYREWGYPLQEKEITISSF